VRASSKLFGILALGVLAAAAAVPGVAKGTSRWVHFPLTLTSSNSAIGQEVSAKKRQYFLQLLFKPTVLFETADSIEILEAKQVLPKNTILYGLQGDYNAACTILDETDPLNIKLKNGKWYNYGDLCFVDDNKDGLFDGYYVGGLNTEKGTFIRKKRTYIEPTKFLSKPRESVKFTAYYHAFFLGIDNNKKYATIQLCSTYDAFEKGGTPSRYAGCLLPQIKIDIKNQTRFFLFGAEFEILSLSDEEAKFVQKTAFGNEPLIIR
jgi:hypothetical protein